MFQILFSISACQAVQAAGTHLLAFCGTKRVRVGARRCQRQTAEKGPSNKVRISS